MKSLNALEASLEKISVHEHPHRRGEAFAQRTIDGNEAAAHVAYHTNEVIALYPITPSAGMGERCSRWAAEHKTNLWGSLPSILSMQSEAGAAGAVHGALQVGALSTTFTSSQGLLLMLPNMFKIAGELTSSVFHIASRSIAMQALSIFGDHTDVMAARSTGWGMLFSNSVQEVMDMALISQMSALQARVPIMHIFDGFRTSHELQTVNVITPEQMRSLLPQNLIDAHRRRALVPENPVIRGTSQGPEAYFQARERANPYYFAMPQVVQASMDTFAQQLGRSYHLFEYEGAPDAERVIVAMGSSCGIVSETVRCLRREGEKVGLLKVRLYRPFSLEHFLAVMPPTVEAIAVLDRTKENGALGEPLYEDVCSAFFESFQSGLRPTQKIPHIVGGRYGLSSKDFQPAMVHGIFEELRQKSPKNHFTIGIEDDITQTSLPYSRSFCVEAEDTVRAIFWGRKADGTTGTVNLSAKLVSEHTDLYAQVYTEVDLRKSASHFISHLRYSPRPIALSCKVRRANYIGVHQFSFLERFSPLTPADQDAVVLLNATHPPDKVWERLPEKVQDIAREKNLQLYVIDAYGLSRRFSLGMKIDAIMQAAFFQLCPVASYPKLLEWLEEHWIEHGYSVEPARRDGLLQVVRAIDTHIYPVDIKAGDRAEPVAPPRLVLSPRSKSFMDLASMTQHPEEELPVSAFPSDGTFPVGTSQFEKRRVADSVPQWDPDLCIQCGKCVLVCPHSVIRAKMVNVEDLENAPDGFQFSELRLLQDSSKRYSLQVSPSDCTGCEICVEECPVEEEVYGKKQKAIVMQPLEKVLEVEEENWSFFTSLPQLTPGSAVEVLGERFSFDKTEEVQFLEPLFEFPSSCGGCGESPYLKILSQLFGERTVIANATGCSSIFGGSLPTTPWKKSERGCGPAWNNSLFEDNAEFGLGMRLALDQKRKTAEYYLKQFSPSLGDLLVEDILLARQNSEKEIEQQRQRVEQLRSRLRSLKLPGVENLLETCDALIKKSIWIVGGDGWAYDIGFGGLDHLFANAHFNVNVLVLDTEGYSSTGGQVSKSTSRGAVVQFAEAGKDTAKKALGLMAMAYGNVYVAQVAMGADTDHTLRAFQEADSYPGTSLIIAFSHCTTHGIEIPKAMEHQRSAARSGYWALFRFDPRRRKEGKNPFKLDVTNISMSVQKHFMEEERFRQLKERYPHIADEMLQAAQEEVEHYWKQLKHQAEHYVEPM